MTVAESGVAGFETAQWYGIVVPVGVPDAIVARLNAESVKVVQDPELAARLARDGTLPAGTSPQEFAAYFRDEVAKGAKVIRISGAKAE